MQRHLTFVGQSFRTIDDNASDGMTSIGMPQQPVAAASALRTGLALLIKQAHGSAGVHYGVIDWKGQLLTSGVLTASLEGVSTAVIGRHSHADSRTSDESLGLRHAFLVHRADQPDTALLFDLMSASGTTTFAGQAISAAVVELPAVVRVGTHLLVMLSSEHAKLGVDGIVERASGALLKHNDVAPNASRFVFTLDDFSDEPFADLDSQPVALAFTPSSSLPHAQAEKTQECVSVRPGQHSLRQNTFRPTHEALARGFMIGRYDRCATPGTMDWDNMMSRVHALLFAMGESVYLADLSSTNGTTHETLGELRLKHLADGDTFWLGRTRLEVEAGS